MVKILQKERLCPKVLKMSQLFVSIKAQKKRRYVLPKMTFVVGIAFFMLYVAHYPSGRFLSTSKKEDLDHLKKEQYTEQNFFHQSTFQRHLMRANTDDKNHTITTTKDNGSEGKIENLTYYEKLEKCKGKLKEPQLSNKTEENNFPSDVFTQTQQANGAVILHIIGIIYMFYALALVCDEFFVPSLDVIAEKLKITPDVAGATFMAAGGSAPELFTSIIGVFIAQSDVGIGTIVGSAVFNILFVIAACAFAAKEALSLTAWPLIRDVFFYSVSLIVLVVFFNDEKIFWYEALALFLWYFCYVIFMKFNEKTEDKLRDIIGLEAINREEGSGGVTLRKSVYRKGLFHLMNETINPGILSIMIGHQQAHAAGQGITGLKTQLQLDSTGEATVNGAQENNKDKSERSSNNLGTQKVNNPTVNSDEDNINLESNSNVEVLDHYSANKDNMVNQAINSKEGSEEGVGEEIDEEPIDMSFPTGGDWKKILLYLISFPIMFPLYYTLPDTKKPKMKKFFAITFLGSIIWIALYSYLMVWWATVAGKVIGIPDTVMGLTFLAAGTSVPDLITSVLVAKQGKGDMAVSSSVGSNIFDVTIGLPVPWLVYAMVHSGNPVNVSSSGVGCSISLLFLMLISVFLSILAFKWKMTKGMGIMMGLLYFVFVIVSVGFDYCWYACPI